jgi:DNA-binding response OmpR family regulator
MSANKVVNGAKILLVDDDADFLLQNEMRFQSSGYTVCTASTMENARQVFAEHNPDVVVLDLMMEEKDAGIVLAHTFRRQKPNLPIVMVTGITRETGMILDSANGDERAWIKANKILPKPIRFDQLKREVEILLAARQ